MFLKKIKRKTPINTSHPILLFVKIKGTGRYLSNPTTMKMKSIIKIIHPRTERKFKRNAFKK